LEFDLPQDLSPEVAELFAKPEVIAAVQHITAHANKGVAEKNKELLGKLSLSQKEINELGGIDTIKTRLSTVEKAEAEAARRAQEAAAASGDVEAIKKAYEDRLASANATIEQFKSEKITNTVKSQLTKAVADAGGDFDLLEPFIMRRVKPTVTEDGSVKLNLFTNEGGPLITEKGEGTVKDLIAEFRNSDKFARMFAADNKAGSGAKSTTGAVSTENPFDKNSPAYSVTKQGQLYTQDPAKARALAAAVGIKLYE
jgi:hypothetical protein